MSEIKKGDLVMVVRPATCCGVTDRYGYIFAAGEIERRVVRCPKCNKNRANQLVSFVADENVWCEVSRLIKIDPPAITQDTLEEIAVEA